MTTHRQKLTNLMPPLRPNDSRLLKDVVVPPLVAEGVLLVTRTGELAAFEESSGEVIWRTPLNVTERLQPHGGVPLVVDEVIYVRSGDELLTIELKSGYIKSRSKAPQVDLLDGAFVDGCIVSYVSAHTLEAWDVSKNRTRWSIRSEFSPVRLVSVGGMVIAGAIGSLSAFEMSAGERIWSIPLDEDQGIGGLALAPDDSLIVALGAEVVSIDAAKGEVRWRAIADVARPGMMAVTDEGEIHLLDLRRYRRLSASSGVELFSRPVAREQLPSIRGSLGSLAASNTHVFAGDLRGPLVAVSRDAEIDWIWEEERQRAASVAPVLSDERLYALTFEGMLQCFERTTRL